MPNPLQFLPSALGQNQLQINYGEIASPVPQSQTDPLYVVLPDWSRDHPFVVAWSQDHGAALPQVGAACLLVGDSRGFTRCVWWDGAFIAPVATGPAGGALSGTFPNPSLSAGTLKTFLQTAASVTTAVATGAVVFTFTASSASAPQTVTHGLGRSPFVFLQNSSGGNSLASTVSATTTTTFTANAFQTAGANISTTAQFWWLAIG